MNRLALTVLALALPLGCSREAPRQRPDEAFGRLHTIAFAGDTVLARRMNAAVQEHGPARPFEGIRQVFSEADVAVVNLECILASSGEPADKGERNPYFFRGRPELVRVLTEAGIDVASLANNHGGDYGPEAVIEGTEILRNAGVDPLGAGRSLDEAMAPVYRQVGDTVVAFVGMDMTQRSSAATADRAGVSFASERQPNDVVSRVRQQVEAAREHAHLVFLVTHWGPNGTEEPGRAHTRLARRLVREAGIDGILGSSAHQLHGLEVVDGRPIIYDSGNVLFDYGSDEWTHKTAIFVLHFDRAGVRWVEAVPVRMQSNRTVMADAEDAEAVVRRLEDLSGRLGTKLWTTPDRAMLGIFDRLTPRRPREAYRPPAKRPVTLPTLTSYRPAVTVAALPPSARPLQVGFGEGFELLGYEMPEQAKRRAGVPITTYWRTSQPTKTSYQLFTHVEPEGGRGPRWIGDHQPADWMYPTDRWQPGEIVVDRHQIRPPGDSATGRHVVYMGLFEGRRRVPVTSEGAPVDADGRVRVGTIDVVE